MSATKLTTSKKPGVKSQNPVTKSSTTNVSRLNNLPIYKVFYLQRTIGNQAAQKLLGLPVIQAQRSRGSRVIPDLDEATVDELSKIPFAVSPEFRQELIDFIVKDREKKGMNFSIMERGRPIYVAKYPDELLRQGASPESLGYTVAPDSAPVNPGEKPLVYIGPEAFGKPTDPLDHRKVLLYTTILHEFQHALQWQKPIVARSMSKTRREVEAFFSDIEKSKTTGLFQQKRLFEYVLKETMGHWKDFVKPGEWTKLSFDEKAQYIRRYAHIVDIAIEALGEGHFLVKDKNKKAEENR